MYKIETGIPVITTGGCSCDQNTDNLNKSLKYRKTKQEEKQQQQKLNCVDAKTVKMRTFNERGLSRKAAGKKERQKV